MALCSLLTTDVLSSKSDEADILMQYLDAIFDTQILPGAETSFGSDETKAVYEDWRKRLIHPFFGLSSFFITQNGAAKGGIRIGPTIKNLIMDEKVRCDSSSQEIINFHVISPLLFLCQNYIIIVFNIVK